LELALIAHDERMFDGRQRALLRIGQWLREREYRFVTITPESHRRVNARSEATARSVRDVFGWSWPFRIDGPIPSEVVAWLSEAGALISEKKDVLRSAVRYSTLGENLFVHSAFPTSANDAVFFGPDTYRFIRFVQSCVPSARRMVDAGCGSGAGGIALAKHAGSVVLADINAAALAFAAVNAELNGVPAEICHSDVLGGVIGEFDLVIANPPYLVDPGARLYRNGGGAHGAALSVRIVAEALARLPAAGGRLLLYTASAIVDGRDTFRELIDPIIGNASAVSYQEIDPDVFGEELSTPAYADVDRIAVVGLDVRR
jgi:release factor glutamine methyltransferase